MTRSAFIPLTLLAAAALVTGAQASHKPGHGPGAPDSLTIRVEPNPIVYGGSVTIDGRFTSTARAGKSVILLSDPAPFDTFARVADTTTSQSGAYSFVQKPLLNTRYRTRQGNVESPVFTVLVRTRVGFRVSDRTPARGERVLFFGRACPEHVGTLVRIQRRTSSGRWATIARTRLREATTTNACPKYRRRVTVRRDGRYRVVVARHDDHARGISRTRFLDVD
jgi:hypothetical protein